LEVETAQARQVRRAGGIAVGALFVELYIQVENFALAEARCAGDGGDHPRGRAPRTPDHRHAGHCQRAERSAGND
jgi:hypothetical protein